MKKKFNIFYFILLVSIFLANKHVYAADPPPGLSCPLAQNAPGNSCGANCPTGKCLTNGTGGCNCDGTTTEPIPDGGLIKETDPNDPIGPIARPTQLKGTLIGLFSNVLRLIMTGGGIYAFIRIVLAGLKFMSAGGDTKAITAAWDSIWQSLLGVIIIISSVVIAALMGQILFGSPTAILVPQVYGPGGQ